VSLGDHQGLLNLQGGFAFDRGFSGIRGTRNGLRDLTAEKVLHNHWAAKPGIFEENLEAWVDNFMKPGNIQGGFSW
jgi:hypothetical protein